MSKKKDKIDPKAVKRTLNVVRPHVKGHSGLMGGGVAALLFEVVFRVLEPWPMKFVIDALAASLGADVDGQAPATVRFLLFAALALVVFIGGRALCNYLATVCFALAGSRVATQLRARVFRHVQSLSQEFHANNRSADTVQRIVMDVGRLQDVAITAGMPLIANVLTLVIMLVIMLIMNAPLAMIVVVTIILFLSTSPRTAKKISSASRKTRKGEGQLANTAQESLSAIRVVQAYGLEETQAKKFGSANARSLKEGVVSKRLAAGLERRTDLLVGFAQAAVLLIGGWQVMREAITPGDLVLFTTYFKTTMKPLRDMAKYTGRIARASASGERVAELLDKAPKIATPSRAHTPREVLGYVRYDDVNAGYGGTPVLHDVNLSIRPGETVGIIGPSGSGKSTMCSLLSRSTDPISGAVTLDGHPLGELDLDFLRNNVSVLHQEAVLFAGTLRENIRFGRLDATDEEIEAAARSAHAHDFISRLPEGYDTVVGERGGTLSGGQRQRVAIARALLRDSPVIVLDEATTGLDAHSTNRVLEAIDELIEGRTTLAVTHDVAVAMRCTRIVWIQDGRLLFSGEPHDLLENNDVFRRWVEAAEFARDDVRLEVKE